jgi:hypothetical protein
MTQYVGLRQSFTYLMKQAIGFGVDCGRGGGAVPLQAIARGGCVAGAQSMAKSLTSALLSRCSDRKSGPCQSCKRDREKTIGV